MKNLKKILALVLAFACAFTMFAGAAFPDQADINEVNAEAVNTLSALGVIDGYADGTFRPNETVTRSQMAKMIYIIRTGRSDASAYNDDVTTFTDISDHWARGYIKYCQSMGIISGKSATRFDPDATVTTQEAAKMLLVTLGYNADTAGLVGAGWGNKTTALADENGLLKDVNCGTTQGMPRQYAAQLIYNALNASTVVYRDGAYTKYDYNGTENATIGQKYMNLAKNDEGVLEAVTKEDGKDTYRITVDGIGSFTKVTNDYSALLGETVKVLYEAGENDKVYGVFSTDDNTVVTAVADDVDKINTTAGKLEIDGVSYKTETANAKNLPVYTTPDMTSFGNINDLVANYKYFTVKFVDCNDNDKIDYAVVTPVVAAKLSYVGASSVTVAAVLNSNNAASVNGSYDLDDDIVLYDGAEKDDYVAVVDDAFTVSGKTEVTKLETVSGTVDATRGDNEFRIDGTWYTMLASENISINDEVEISVIGTFAFSLDATASSVSASNVLFVDDAASIESGLSKGDVEADVYFADGTSQTVRITKYADQDIDEAKVDANRNGKLDENETTALTVAALKGKMFKFSMDGSNYEIDELTQGSYDSLIEKNGTKIVDGRLTVEGGAVIRFVNEAIVFVKTGDDTAVVSGATVNGWNDIINSGDGQTTTKVGVVQALSNDSNGYAYARIAAINLTGTNSIPGGTYQYAYVTSKVNTVADDMFEFDIYTGEGDVTTVVTEDTGVTEGAFIKYSVVADNEIEVNEIKTVANAVAITGFDSKGINFSDGQDLDFADDYVVIGADTKDHDNLVGGSLDTADTIDNTTYLNAVYFTVDGDVAAVFMGNENRIYKDNVAQTTAEGEETAVVYDVPETVNDAWPDGTVNYDVDQTDNNITVTATKAQGNYSSTSYKLLADGAQVATATVEDGNTLTFVFTATKDITTLTMEANA